MGKIVEISRYRALRRNEFLDRYGQKLETLLRTHLRNNFNIDIRQLHSLYCQYQASESQTQWEFMDLRDILDDFVSKHVIGELTAELSKQYWFDSSIWTHEELTERCISILILEDSTAVPG